MQIAAPTRPPSQAVLHWAQHAQWMIFTSRHAVDAAVALWPKPPPVHIAAIGEATARQLKQAAWPVHWLAPHSDSESLLNDPQAPAWHGDIALMAGRGGRRQLKYQLTARGCRVKKLLLYQRQAMEVSASDFGQAIQAKPIAVFSSGFALRQWQGLAQKHQRESALLLDALVASTRLCKLASQLGFAGRIQALPRMSDKALLTAIKEWKHD